MHHPLPLLTALATLLFTAGCVTVPATAPPPERLQAAAVSTPSAVPVPTQASGRAAIVTTDPSRTPQPGHDKHRGPQHRPSRPAPAPARPRMAVPPEPYRRAAADRHAAPAPRRHRSRPRRTFRPQPTYDMRTVCALAQQPAAPSEARALCDAYVR